MNNIVFTNYRCVTGIKLTLKAQRPVQAQRVGVKLQQAFAFDELQYVDTPVLFRYVDHQLGHRVLAEHRPAPDVRQFQRVGFEGLVGHSGPLVRRQRLNFEAGRALW